MSIVAAIRDMLAKGFTVEQALSAAEAFEAAQMPPRTARQERNRRYYESKKASEKRLKASYSDGVLKRLKASETSEFKTPSRGDARVEDNLLPKKISGKTENKNISPEADKSAPVAVIGLPTVSEGDFPVSQADIDGWAEAFPGVDVRQQLAAMRQWLLANPTRRKTKRGMRKFVVSWLDRRQNAAPPPAQRSTAPPQRSIDDALDDIVNGKSHVPFTGPTIDASDNRPDWRGAENLVPFHALSAGRRSG